MWNKRLPGESFQDASFRLYIEHFCPLNHKSEEGLSYQRDRLFVLIMLFFFPLAILIYFPSVSIAFYMHLTVLYISDTAAILALTLLFFTRKISLQHKKYFFSALFYFLAAILLVYLGPSGPGTIILFASSILITLVISRKSGLVSLLANALLLVITLVILPAAKWSYPGIPSLTVVGALVISLNMLAFNILSVLGLDALIQALNNSLLKEKKAEQEIKDFNTTLEKKIKDRTQELADSNQKLSEEIGRHELSRKELEIKSGELENFFDLTPNLLCISNAAGCFLKVNKAFELILGYSTQELLNRNLIEFIHPEDSWQVQDSLRNLRNDSGLLNFINRFRKKDGTYSYIEWQVILYNQFIYAAAVDVTGHTVIEETLRRARVDAESANLAKSEFLANMSHEIRTPMNAVLGYSELLGSTKLDNVQKEYVESLKSSGKSLLRLINDILDISKIEAGKLELEYDFISTTDFFSEFERIFAFKIREKGLSFHLEMGPSIPKGIMVDESRLRQIVFNLLGNAIKFTSEGVIRIQVYTEASTVQKIEEPGKDTVDLFIAVTDTGCGINPEMQDRIFEPFVQERNYSSTGGTGLGLPISRRLVHLMQGTISLASEFGKGSTFVVHIPRVECLREFSGIQPGSHSIPAGIRFGKARLLIIDDVQHNRNYLRDALKDTSIETFEADDGVRGLDMARSLKPDLIISDIRMPGMNGYELLEKIKQDPSIRHIPVIAYSASVLQSQQAALLNSAFSGLLIKPVKLQELYNELKKFLPYELSYVEEAFATPIKFPGGLKDPGDLIRSLETDFHTTWKTFAVRQPIGQICLFADSIIELGTRHNAADVVQYGEELRVAAVNFNIESVLNLLKSYINLISALKKQNPQIPE